MIVDQATIDAVLRRKMRCRMLRLPFERGSEGELLSCPVVKGRAYKLRTRAGGESQVTVTVSEVRREKLGAITRQDARREGYASIDSATTAWGRRHGDLDRDRWVWVVAFIVGDEADYFAQDTTLFLSRGGAYTTVASRQAVPGDPPVIDEEAVARYVADARERRGEEQRLQVRAKAGELETLSASIADMKARRLLKKAARAVEAAAAAIPSDATLDSGVKVELSELGAQAEAPTSSAAGAPVSPEREAA